MGLKELNMGMFKKSCCCTSYAAPDSNPDPKKFKILRSASINGHLVLEVFYPDCKNFEGKKIMLYLFMPSVEELLSRTNGELDPHFSQGAKPSPFARFRPSFDGFGSASFLAQCINPIDKL